MRWSSRRRDIASVIFVGVVVVVVVGLMVAYQPRPTRHPGGDPQGRLMVEMAPVATVVPGFEHGNIPWISPPCDSCKFPQKYALKIEPFWDSCDGVASTAGWDPAIIQMGLVWTGTSQALVAAIDSGLRSRGWSPIQNPPSWAEDQASYRTWDFPPGQSPSETFGLNSPLDGLGWMVSIEAKPVGTLVDCSR